MDWNSLQAVAQGLTLKDLLLLVDKSSRNVKNNADLVKNDVSNYYDFVSNLDSVIKFNKSLKNLTLILSKIHLFDHEFHCTMSLGRMSQFILTDDNFTKDYFDFLLSSVYQFINLIEFKLINISEFDSSSCKISDSCKNEYNELKRAFLKSEKFFYTKIYKSSRGYDKEFFEDMVALLGS